MLRTELERNGHDTTVLDPDTTVPYIPPKEQGGLFGTDFLPKAFLEQDNDLEPSGPQTESLGLEIVEDDSEIKQGEFIRVKLDDLNTVVQQRKVYDQIDTLADNIKEEGILIHPILVARFSSADTVRNYLVHAYGTVGKKVPPEQRKRVSDLSPTVYKGQEVFYVVIAGHRRLRALRKLEDSSKIVQVLDDPDPLWALKLQVSENTSRLPEDYDRAEANGDLYSVEKAINPDLTIGQFAKMVGHTRDVVKRDLRYYQLPEDVKAYVVPATKEDNEEGDTVLDDQPRLPFGVISELGRMVERKAPMHDVRFLARNFWNENVTNQKEASRRVTRYLQAYSTGDMSMNDLFGVNVARLSAIRNRVEAARRLSYALDGANSYLDRIKMAKELGLGDSLEDGVSFAGAATRIRSFAETVIALIPMMKKELTSSERKKIRNAMIELKKLADEYEGLNPQEINAGEEVKLTS